jgi:hypothetical protein
MRDYFKILSSIIAALFSLAMIVSVALGVSALVFGSPGSVEQRD